MLGVRTDHFGADETPARDIDVDVQQAGIAQHHAASPLVLERDLPRDESAGREVGVARADHGELRIGEYDGERRAPRRVANIGETRGVFPRDAAFVGRFVQDRQVVAGIARDEDRRGPALHRGPVEPRHAPRVELRAMCFRGPGRGRSASVPWRRARSRRLPRAQLPSVRR